MTPKAQETKGKKIDKLYFTKIKKKNCSSKDIMKKVKIQPTGWEKTFANHLSDMGPVSKIYKEQLQLNNKKSNNLILK